MTTNTDHDVLIVGGGPVGVLNALALAQRGVPVRLFERNDTIVESPRAMVYHWSVLEGLDDLDVLEEARTRGFSKQDTDWLVWGTGERIRADLAHLEGRTRFAYNMHLGQNELVRIALEKLAAFDHAEVHWGREVVDVTQDEDSVSVVIRSRDGELEEVSGEWLLGADGAGSAVRHALGIGFDGMTWPERFVATNIRYDFEGNGYARSNNQIDPVCGAIVSKIDRTGLWRVTYMEDAALTEETVRERMDAYFAAVLPGSKEYELVQFSPYKMHQRAADTFRSGRVLLLGDAAHATNPTGGLGLTSGLFDTYSLYPALLGVIDGRLHESVLDRWAHERRRIFTEIASPQASENKRLVYHSADPERLEADLVTLRHTYTDPEARLAQLSFPARLQTDVTRA